jgi:hypothetical protein
MEPGLTLRIQTLLPYDGPAVPPRSVDIGQGVTLDSVAIHLPDGYTYSDL